MSVDLREPDRHLNGRPPAPPPPSPSPTGIPDTDAARIARAKDLIAGRVKPEPMPTPPAVQAFFAKSMVGREEFFTPEAVRRTINHLNLQFYFGGRVVACYTTPDGDYIPLAEDADITPLYEALTREEMSVGGACIYHPHEFSDGSDGL